MTPSIRLNGHVPIRISECVIVGTGVSALDLHLSAAITGAISSSYRLCKVT
jgi:hypothetical protein